MTEQRGQFIVVEGIDGAGKSTHAKMICDYLEAHFVAEDRQCKLTREPGGSDIGDLVRKILLDPSKPLDPTAELFFLYGERTQHVKHVITPALEEGSWVVCERFVGSSYAYQGGGKGLDRTLIEGLTRWAISEKPILTLLLDIPTEVAKKRIEKRGQTDRFEREKIEFFESVRNAFLLLADADSSWERIDANRPQDEVWADIQSVLDERLSEFQR